MHDYQPAVPTPAQECLELFDACFSKLPASLEEWSDARRIELISWACALGIKTEAPTSHASSGGISQPDTEVAEAMAVLTSLLRAYLRNLLDDSELSMEEKEETDSITDIRLAVRDVVWKSVTQTGITLNQEGPVVGGHTLGNSE